MPATRRSTARVKSSMVTSAPCRRVAVERSFVDEVGKIGAREARCHRSDLVDIEVGGWLDLAHVHLENRGAARLLRSVQRHLSVEASRTCQGRVQDLGAVGGRQQDNADARVKAVEFSQELVQRLLLLVVAAETTSGARAPKAVQLIDEDDARLCLACLLEEVANTGCTDADEHLDELGARDRKERHACLTCNCARQQRFAGTRRPHKQNALWNAGARAARSPRAS